MADSDSLKALDQDPLMGFKLAGRYKILSLIGRGGMGVVYKACDERIDRSVAIKVLHSDMVSNAEAIQRFFQEAKTISQIQHHNIVTLYDFGISNKGQPYLVMDFLDGMSLKDLIAQSGPLPLKRVEVVFKQVTHALQAAHEARLIHRDLKPANIMLRKLSAGDDWVTLVDFGLSKLINKGRQEVFHVTRSGDISGSPPYMSPEQCRALSLDSRSDIYSLAVCLYEAISGRLPFTAKLAIEIIDCHLNVLPRPLCETTPELQVCTELTNLLTKALDKDPEKRYQTAEEFGRRFSEALELDSIKLRAFIYRTRGASSKELPKEEQAIQNEASCHVHDQTSHNTELSTERKAAIQVDIQESPGPAPNDPRDDGTNGHIEIAGSRVPLAQQGLRQSGQHEPMGFSNRAKKAMSRSMNRSGMPCPAKVIALVLILTVVYLGSLVWQNDTFVRSMNKMITALNLSH